MGITASVLDDILRAIAPSDDTLDAVRNRRDEVLSFVAQYPGALRTRMRQARSPTGRQTTIRTLMVAWCLTGGGIELGPDGDDEGPKILWKICARTCGMPSGSPSPHGLPSFKTGYSRDL
jgi:hypothetical protein